MNYSLEIRGHNKQVHIDIEEEMAKKKNGLFTFILRVNNGNCVDCVILENTDARDYLALKSITVEELRIPRPDGERSQTNTIRTDNIQHQASERSSGLNNNISSQTETKKI